MNKSKKNTENAHKINMNTSITQKTTTETHTKNTKSTSISKNNKITKREQTRTRKTQQI